MKITFDLFQGDCPPSQDIIEWVPGWWYHAKGLPVEKGVTEEGNEWLLVGFTLSNDKATEIIKRTIEDGVETLFENDGQFILVIWRKSSNSVDIYRDRTGILPIYYHEGQGTTTISICIGNAMVLSNEKSVHSQSLLHQYPLYRRGFAPETQFADIKTLSALQSLSIHDGRISQNAHPMMSAPREQYRTIESAANDLGEVLSRAVQKRIKACKRLGAWLSGGNDSSLLVALTRKYYHEELTTIFITFEDYDRNYRQYARRVSYQYDTVHKELELSTKDYLNLWPETIRIIQAPLNHPGIVGQTAGFKCLSGAVDGMLTGEGADAVFGGPYWAPLLALSYLGKVLPEPARMVLKRLSKRIQGKTLITKGIAKSLRALGTPLQKYLHAEESHGVEEDMNRVFNHGTWEQAMNVRSNLTQGESLCGLFSFHMLHWIPLNVAVETMLGFNYGITSIYPFLDYDLLQASLRLPVHLRYHYSTKKAALKRYCLNYFDREFVYKPKEGFGVPLGKWCAKPEFAPILGLPLEERSLRRGWWKEKDLRQIMELHKSGKGTDKSAESIPWITTNLELWARICLEGDSPDRYKV